MPCRLDEIIVFRQLTKGEVKEIADIMLREVFKRADTKGIKIDVTERFKVRQQLPMPLYALTYQPCSRLHPKLSRHLALCSHIALGMHSPISLQDWSVGTMYVVTLLLPLLPT